MSNYEIEIDEMVGLSTPDHQRDNEVDALLAGLGINRADVETESTEHWTDELQQSPAGPISVPVLGQHDTECIQSATKAALSLPVEFGGTIGLADFGQLGFALPPQITQVIKKAEMSDAEAAGVLVYFQNAFQIANSVRGDVEAITVRGEDDLESMEVAKTFQKTLAAERISLTKKHKLIKAVPLRQCQLIDAIKRYLLELIEPVEALAKSKADFALNAANARLQAIADERTEQLRAFGVTATWDLLKATHDEFSIILAGSKAHYEAAEAEKHRDEAERVEREQRQALELAAAQAELAETRKRFEQLELERLTELAARENAETEAKQAAEQLAASTDSVKIAAYLRNLRSVERPVVETEQGKTAITLFFTKLALAIQALESDLGVSG